jgi:NAD-dependent dihydropyrimidine dehydrogenase PreA subunit
LKLARSLAISEKRLLGWEPSVTTRGYDENGQQVPLSEAWETVAETEPEWDDLSRESMAGLAIFERGVHACGFHLSLTTDRANHFAIEEDECLVCASMERFERIRSEADKTVLDRMGGNKAPAALGRPSDGRITYIKPKASPAVSALLDGLTLPTE